jgi:hypothetical protein
MDDRILAPETDGQPRGLDVRNLDFDVATDAATTQPPKMLVQPRQV